MIKTSLLSKKKCRLIKYDFHVPIYRSDFSLIIASSEDFVKYMKKKYDIELVLDDEDRTGGRYFEPFKKAPFIIHLKDWNWYIAEQVNLTHELLHYVIYVMNDVGVSLHYSSQEAYTYLLSLIQGIVWDKLKTEWENEKK